MSEIVLLGWDGVTPVPDFSAPSWRWYGGYGKEITMPRKKNESGGRMSKSLAEGVHEQPEPIVGPTHGDALPDRAKFTEIVGDGPFDHLRLGSQVSFVLDDGPGCGQARPATVVHLHNSTGLVNLQVLTDSTNNRHGLPVGNDLLPPLMWKTSVSYNADKALGTWHWWWE